MRGLRLVLLQCECVQEYGFVRVPYSHSLCFVTLGQQAISVYGRHSMVNLVGYTERISLLNALPMAAASTIPAHVPFFGTQCAFMLHAFDRHIMHRLGPERVTGRITPCS